ncbi:MAG TPA: lipoyl(octanoyl) transferase LipB [Bacteroidales bacterium]|jgi:lipoyl(octanoyl) transferase|nr:lipoyl(octanoyl) transferase LipB [Bacteroidales bacterium]HNV96240.1 lipoyl(octanoyl) transferase LipB [Bacteroidales bacterium]HOU98373.1 lipoyl(octanoyl) transferase LipB [Bacteroidales bacterium]
MYSAEYQDIGLIEYKKAWDYQDELHAQVLKNRENATSTDSLGYIIFCEHPHVYTLGNSGNNSNLLISDEMLQRINATYYKTNRGGDITYHGPGQIVGYPILDLQKLNMGIKNYIYNIEEAIIQTLSDYSITAERLEGATGVWLDSSHPSKARKICAIGVRVSHWISMHGFAFNINTDLNYFNYINPCGFKDKGVTSLQKELGHPIQIEEVKTKLLNHFTHLFNIKT